MTDCLFCKIIAGEIPSRTVYEDDLIKVIMNINPNTNGHLLILPKKHYTNIMDIDEKIVTHSLEVTRNTLYDLLKRPEILIENLKHWIDIDYSKEVIEQVEIQDKYEGYIKKANREAEKMLNLEKVKIPDNINYDDIHNLASEARQKLSNVKPTTIAQASRISGVNPADISILMIYLKKRGI